MGFRQGGFPEMTHTASLTGCPRNCFFPHSQEGGKAGSQYWQHDTLHAIQMAITVALTLQPHHVWFAHWEKKGNLQKKDMEHCYRTQCCHDCLPAKNIRTFCLPNYMWVGPKSYLGCWLLDSFTSLSSEVQESTFKGGWIVLRSSVLYSPCWELNFIFSLNSNVWLDEIGSFFAWLYFGTALSSLPLGGPVFVKLVWWDLRV